MGTVPIEPLLFKLHSRPQARLCRLPGGSSCLQEGHPAGPSAPMPLLTTRTHLVLCCLTHTRLRRPRFGYPGTATVHSAAVGGQGTSGFRVQGKPCRFRVEVLGKPYRWRGTCCTLPPPKSMAATVCPGSWPSFPSR